MRLLFVLRREERGHPAPGLRACSSGTSSLQQLLALGLEALPVDVPTLNHQYLHKSKPCGRAFMREPLPTLKFFEGKLGSSRVKQTPRRPQGPVCSSVAGSGLPSARQGWQKGAARFLPAPLVQAEWQTPK